MKMKRGRRLGSWVDDTAIRDGRELDSRKGRGKNWSLRLGFDTFNCIYAPGRVRAVRRNDLLWMHHNGSGSVQKCGRWRRGEGGNKMGGNDAKVSKRKEPGTGSLRLETSREQIPVICF
jgi:hypothetical protein